MATAHVSFARPATRSYLNNFTEHRRTAVATFGEGERFPGLSKSASCPGPGHYRVGRDLPESPKDRAVAHTHTHMVAASRVSAILGCLRVVCAGVEARLPSPKICCCARVCARRAPAAPLPDCAAADGAAETRLASLREAISEAVGAGALRRTDATMAAAVASALFGAPRRPPLVGAYIGGGLRPGAPHRSCWRYRCRLKRRRRSAPRDGCGVPWWAGPCHARRPTSLRALAGVCRTPRGPRGGPGLWRRHVLRWARAIGSAEHMGSRCGMGSGGLRRPHWRRRPHGLHHLRRLRRPQGLQRRHGLRPPQSSRRHLSLVLLIAPNTLRHTTGEAGSGDRSIPLWGAKLVEGKHVEGEGEAAVCRA